MIRRWLDTVVYRDFGDSWDEVMMRDRIEAVIGPSSQVIDVGAGRGTKGVLSFAGRCKRAVGVDVDPVVRDNPHVDESKVIALPGCGIPYDAATFDVAFCNSVLEHVQDADRFFSEVARVLKPGGRFFAKTPNRYHYVAIAAAVTPHWFHRFYNRLRGRQAVDTFATTYACNTRRQMRAACARHGLTVTSLRVVEGRPEYLRINGLLYLLGALYEKIVNAAPWFEGVRCVIFLEAVKHDGGSVGSR